eukprot:GHVS01105489.1.p1 GENE.GHVS01105489.1~~GHVS01105489.1.p1  ORF type:complete len:293 (+),score=59.03 GHVS01105489.1:27-905(+)
MWWWEKDVQCWEDVEEILDLQCAKKLMELLGTSISSVDHFIEQFVFAHDLHSLNSLSFQVVMSAMENQMPDVYLRNSQIEIYIKYIICKNVFCRAEPSVQAAARFPFHFSLLFSSETVTTTMAPPLPFSPPPTNLFLCFLSANPPPPPPNPFDRAVRHAIAGAKPDVPGEGEMQLREVPPLLAQEYHFLGPSSHPSGPVSKHLSSGGGGGGGTEQERGRKRPIGVAEEEKRSEDDHNPSQWRGNQGGRTWLSDALLDVIGREHQGKNRKFVIARRTCARTCAPMLNKRMCTC